MRIDLGALALIALTAAAPADRPAFEYKGFKAGETIAPERLASCEPSEDTVICSTFNATVAGTNVTNEQITFYQGKLSHLRIAMVPGAFEPITKAMTAKYGEPCEKGVRGVRVYYEWCFATGKMLAQLYYPSMSTAWIEYTDEVKVPEKPPTIDF